MQTLIFSAEAVTNMDNTDRIHYHSQSPTFPFATIRATIHLIYKLDSDVVFRATMAIINAHIIKDANVMNVPPQDIKPRVIVSLPAQPILPTIFLLIRTSMPEQAIERPL